MYQPRPPAEQGLTEGSVVSANLRVPGVGPLPPWMSQSNQCQVWAIAIAATNVAKQQHVAAEPRPSCGAHSNRKGCALPQGGGHRAPGGPHHGTFNLAGCSVGLAAYGALLVAPAADEPVVPGARVRTTDGGGSG